MAAPAAVARPAPSAPPARALVGRASDPLLLGGLSLLIPLGVALLVSGPASHAALGKLEHILAVGLALPHFLASYVLLYWDYRRRLLEPKVLAVAAGVPLLLAAALGQVFLSSAPALPLRWIVLSMFMFSSWHYLKQAFGCAVVSCAVAGTPLSGDERQALRANLWSLGALSFIVPNCGASSFTFAGLPYGGLGLPRALAWLGYAALAASASWLVAALLRRKSAPAPAAAAAVLGFYAWSLPILLNPGLFYAFRFVPFAAALHSLQYLTFVAPLRWRRLQLSSPGGVIPKPRLWRHAAGWVALLAAGPTVFYAVPGFFDRAVAYDRARLGPIFFVAAMHLFINIHHYFIDTVIWRRDNADLRELVASRS